MGEFELIRRFFQRPARHATLGVGDDCALLPPVPGQQLAISSDMLVEGRHFFPNIDPARLGHKALAVNLSDLAACGAQPRAFTLALALPEANESWLAAFAGGLFALAEQHGCELIGGDTTRGPLNLCITIFGDEPHQQALLRSGARAGDDLWVSGTLGEARMALEVLRGQLQLEAALFQRCRDRLELPTPRVALGLALRGIATAAADVSDGLLGDLGHILQASGVGARLDSTAVLDLLPPNPLELERQQICALTGGDDYELVFTAPPQARGQVLAAGRQNATAVTRIGRIEADPGLRLLDAQGRDVHLDPRLRSFDHFAQPR